MQPLVINHQVDSNEAWFELRLDADQPVFQGHFPDQPVLAGVVQLTWAVSLARKWLAIEGEFAGMEVIKFQRMIIPPAELRLELTWRPEQHKLLFRYLREGELCSSGRIRLERPV